MFCTWERGKMPQKHFCSLFLGGGILYIQLHCYWCFTKSKHKVPSFPRFFIMEAPMSWKAMSKWMSLLFSFINLSFVIGCRLSLLGWRMGEQHVFLPLLVDNPGFSSFWSDIMGFDVSASYSVPFLLCADLGNLLRRPPPPNPHTATNQQNPIPPK